MPYNLVLLSEKQHDPSRPRSWGPPHVTLDSRRESSIRAANLGTDAIHLVRRAKVTEGRGLKILSMLGETPILNDVDDLLTQAFRMGFNLHTTNPKLAKQLLEAQKADNK